MFSGISTKQHGDIIYTFIPQAWSGVAVESDVNTPCSSDIWL